MAKDKIFYLACFSFMAGILWRSFLPVSGTEIFYFGLIYTLFILFSIFVVKKNWEVAISVCAIALLVGAVRFQTVDVGAPASLSQSVGQNVVLIGTIVDEPASASGTIGTKFTLRSGKTGIVIFAKDDTEYKYGDEVEVEGKLEKPANFMTDQGLEFDYVNYLRKDGIFFVMHNPDTRVLSSGHGSLSKRILFAGKEKFEIVLRKLIPEPESVVLEGMILGNRDAFSDTLRNWFTRTGTIHLVTIGGYHVTLVAGWVMRIFAFLPVYGGIIAGIITILLYVLVTGGAQTSIRAGIMAALALFAGVTGRTYDAGRALILAAVIMVFINPFVLAYDISFQLSFMATIAVIFLSPRVEPYLHFIPWKWLRDIAAITLSMYAFALPFILYRMGNLSLVSLPANIILVPLLPLTMLMGFITGFAGLVYLPFGIIPAKISYLLLLYQMTAIGLLSNLPFAALTISYFPLALVLLIYAIFVFIFFFPAKLNFRLAVLLIPLVITFTAAGIIFHQQKERITEAQNKLTELLNSNKEEGIYVPDAKTKNSNCVTDGPRPDHACTPGAIFTDALPEQICVRGYTKTVRNVSTGLRAEIYQEYGITYPAPRGEYEVDHLIPLALGGSNDPANLFPEAAEPTPGFHEKDIVEVFLQEEVCAGRAKLSLAQAQIAKDWLPIYENMSSTAISRIKQKYGGTANQ